MHLCDDPQCIKMQFVEKKIFSMDYRHEDETLMQ